MNQDFSDVAYAAIEQFKMTLKNSEVDLPEEIVSFATVQTLFQHGQHIKVHQVNQTAVDPYKIVCWYGFSLFSVLGLGEDPTDANIKLLGSIARSMISTLEGFLNVDSNGRIILPLHTRLFLLQLIEEEQKGNGDHGIGKNGLYAAFHCAVAALQCIEDPDQRLKVI